MLSIYIQTCFSDHLYRKTTCLQRPHFLFSLENSFSLKHVLKEPEHKDHFSCLPCVVFIDRFDCSTNCLILQGETRALKGSVLRGSAIRIILSVGGARCWRSPSVSWSHFTMATRILSWTDLILGVMESGRPECKFSCQ